MDSEATQTLTPVELTARVVASGGRFVASVDGLDVEATGRTRTAAEDALVQSMRGWLERPDTTGRLGDLLGIEGLDEETEIVLQFVDEQDEPAHEADE